MCVCVCVCVCARARASARCARVRACDWDLFKISIALSHPLFWNSLPLHFRPYRSYHSQGKPPWAPYRSYQTVRDGQSLTSSSSPFPSSIHSFSAVCHEMSLNLKLGNLRYQHVSNLQVLLVILILKSRFYKKILKKINDVTCFWRLHIWRRPFWENRLESFHCALSSFFFFNP